MCPVPLLRHAWQHLECHLGVLYAGACQALVFVLGPMSFLPPPPFASQPKAPEDWGNKMLGGATGWKRAAFK